MVNTDPRMDFCNKNKRISLCKLKVFLISCMNVYYVQREKIMVDISGSIMEFHCTKIWIRHQSFADLQKIENCHKEHASIGDALRAELCQTMKAKLCQNSTSALTVAPPVSL